MKRTMALGHLTLVQDQTLISGGSVKKAILLDHKSTTWLIQEQVTIVLFAVILLSCLDLMTWRLLIHKF